MELKFPDGFLWGAATSAHQVEGGTINDWTEWERENAKRLAQSASRKSWPDYILSGYPNPLEPANYISGRAGDHYNRFREDFDIAKSLGHNAHRFSIEWSRIEPEEGKFDEKEIEHYREVIKALRERGMEPFVTLWHWTNPVWIGDINAWINKDTVKYFLRYAEKMFKVYGDLVKFWTPLNEPGTAVSHGYLFGCQPPGLKNKYFANAAFKNLMRVQKKIYELAKSIRPEFQIGCSHFMFYQKPYNNLPWNILAAKIFDYLADRRFFKAFRDSCDFFGVQYYQPFFVNIRFGGRYFWLMENKQTGERRNDLGWQIAPEGIYHVLKKAAKIGKPIYITENGLPDAQDKSRGKFIIEHLRFLHRAISEGVDVRGYFYWSLLDNFEFVEMRGFWPRFGLVEVDYKTLERKIRPSAWEYAEICKSNSLEPNS